MDNPDVAAQIRQFIEEAPVGEKMSLNFHGDPFMIDVVMTFKGGWTVTQSIIPGKPFEFTKGEDGYLKQVDVYIRDFEGLKNV